MRQLSFDALQVAALYELYLSTLVDGFISISAEDLAGRIGHGCTRGYLIVALTELDSQGLIVYNTNTTARTSSIKPLGIRAVEKGLSEPNSAFSKIRDAREGYVEDRVVTVKAVPAADRIVKVDHNGGPAVEIIEAAGDLQKKIRLGNDLGEFTPEEAEAAQSEVAQIEQAMRADWVRPDQLFGFARKTLKWIAEKSAGAAVGKAALALLALIATFFGLSI